MSNILKGLQLNELSNSKLGQYKTAAAADAKKADSAGDYKRGDKRFSGIVKATKKQFANDEKQLKEFATDDGEGGEEDSLRKYAKMWYNGDLGTQQQIEKILDRMGWEIGELESEEGGAFVVQSGDENGDSYIGFTAADLTGNVDEAYNNYHANRTGFSRGARDDERHDLDKPTQVWGLKINGKVWSKGGADVTFTSKQAALNARNAILKNKPDLEIGLVTKGGVAEGEGNFAGDTPVNLGGDTVKRLQVGDIVKYFGQKAKILAMSKTGNTSRITIANDMGGVTKDVLTSDLKRTGLSEEELDENLNKWFKEKWVRFGPDGKIRGDCARGDDSEGKPKCLPQSKAHSLGKKGRASAASRKRREDPNPERSGKAINVNTKKTNEEQLDELSCWSGYHRVAGTKAGFPGSCAKNKTNESEHSCPHCGGEMVSEELMNEKKDACYYKVKSRYKVWPSAYASGALVKCRKKGASNWGTGGKSNESIEEGWKEEAQDLEDWSKEVNMKLYRAHESQRPALAKQLSKLEQKHFGSEFTHPNLTNIVWSALRALQKGDMVHYDPQSVGQMPFGNIVGDDARIIASSGLSKYDVTGYRGLQRAGIVDTIEQFLHLRDLADNQGQAILKYANMPPVAAWMQFIKDIGWSKDDMNEEVQSKTDDKLLAYYAQRKAEKQKQQSQSQDQLDEKWTQKYKDSINCSNPKGFSQKAHCAGKQKNESAIMKGLSL